MNLFSGSDHHLDDDLSSDPLRFMYVCLDIEARGVVKSPHMPLHVWAL